MPKIDAKRLMAAAELALAKLEEMLPAAKGGSGSAYMQAIGVFARGTAELVRVAREYEMESRIAELEAELARRDKHIRELIKNA